MKEVPVIDLSKLHAGGSGLEQLDEACRRWGFLQVTHHGIDEALIESVHAQTRAFFALPFEEKQSLVRTDLNVWGFYDRELTKNTRDWKEIFDVGAAADEGPLAGARPQWPESLEGFQTTIQAFMAECRRVGGELLQGISLNLGMPQECLLEHFTDDDTSFLRLNYYPVCDDPAPPDAPTVPQAGHLGINRHTDAGALTVLLQDEHPGLQVLHEGEWCIVAPRRDALVINIGDIVQVWSNDIYTAALHRVIASSDAARYSVPYFFNPAYETDYAPLPSVCDESRPARYGPINWGEFRAGRAAGDYADYGEEIQISHFRI